MICTKMLEDSVYDFQNNEECRVILCDATGGEGRNFQNADWVIHVDLPWTANAIEQRIGRLDRLGRDKDHMQVNSVVFYGNGTIEEAYPESEWQETVRKAGRISRDKAKKKDI